ncbi:MAG: HNH endonuclease signature motif containing protein [Candidatus Binatia bacterium]
MRVLRTIAPRIGRLLRVVVDQRIYRSFGYPTFADYARERLGISARKAWALLKLEKATLRSNDLDRAYRDGRLSWVRALSLLPVLDRQNAAAWIARAETVTVRRLNDEVEWVLTSRDVLGSSVSLAPPPIDSPLRSPVRVTAPEECRDLPPAVRVQLRAHGFDQIDAVGEYQFLSAALAQDRSPPALEVSDAEIRFTGPASVVALLRDVLDAFADGAEPRWTALERLLRHVITHWENTPRHHDPVFARDGWRCTVPACSSRRNLHDHHLRFRSRGGDNARDNRTTVCAAHHLHGIHDGTIQASGTAPYAIEWQLGVRARTTPFLTFVGDRYGTPETSDARFMPAKVSSMP